MANKTKNGIIPYILIGIPLLVGGYFIFKSLSKKKDNKNDNKNTSEQPKPQPQPTITTTTPQIVNNNGNTNTFPLKKGSYGSKVKELQLALLANDPNSLPKYGSDSDFGSETEAAVKKVLGKISVDSQSEIDKIKKPKSIWDIIF